MMAGEVARTLFIFDFDDTVVEGTIEYEAMNVASPHLVNGMLSQMDMASWPETVDHIMGELHRAGYGKEAVLERVLAMKLFSGALAVMKKIQTCPHVDMMVLSGANTGLINAVLSHIGMRDAFLHVIANNGYYDDSGRLRVKRYHIHECPRCPGICKGTVLKELLAGGCYSRVVYVGDGSNDVCPCTQLSEGDHVVARERFPLAESLKKADKEDPLTKAHVHTVDFRKSDILESTLTALLPATATTSLAAGVTSTKQVLFVFDFDRTLTDTNTSLHVFDVAPELNLRSRVSELRQKIPNWALLMDHMMEQIHNAGHDQEEVLSHMKKAEFFSGMLAALWKISTCAGAEMVVLSDSNTIFIDLLLNKVGLRRAFSHIFSNRAYFDGRGRLHVSGCHSHHCQRCQRSSNLCKGTVLRELLAGGHYSSVVYVGDGEGDVCPCTLLSGGDHVVARESFPLAERLREAAVKGQAVKAHVHVVDFKQSDVVESLLTSLLPATTRSE